MESFPTTVETFCFIFEICKLKCHGLCSLWLFSIALSSLSQMGIPMTTNWDVCTHLQCWRGYWLSWLKVLNQMVKWYLQVGQNNSFHILLTLLVVICIIRVNDGVIKYILQKKSVAMSILVWRILPEEKFINTVCVSYLVDTILCNVKGFVFNVLSFSFLSTVEWGAWWFSQYSYMMWLNAALRSPPTLYLKSSCTCTAHSSLTLLRFWLEERLRGNQNLTFLVWE
jgi:hypothetical protein